MKNLSVYEMSVIVFIAQTIFLYLWSINIKHISQDKMWSAIFSNAGVSICWIVGVAIGVNAMMEGQILPIVAHLGGGSLGTYIAMRKKHNERIAKEALVFDSNARLHQQHPNAEVGDIEWCGSIGGQVRLDKNNKWVKV